MPNQVLTLNRLSSLLWVLLGLFMLSRAVAADLVFNPATPSVVVGQTLTLSVSGTSGDITWTPSKGQIQGVGNQVSYIAPAEAGVAAVVVVDGAGNVGTVKITVTHKQLVSLENANWKVFTNRSWIAAIALSEDEKILWVGTHGGLEQRDAVTGELLKVFTNLDGLPDNNVGAIANDGNGGLWLGTWGGGLVHMNSQGSMEIFNTINSAIPDNWVSVLMNDTENGLWIGMDNGHLAHLNSNREWSIFTSTNSDLPDNAHINALVRDGNNGLWIGTWEGGLVHLNSHGEWVVFNTQNSMLPHNTVTSISINNKGVWIGTRNGLVYMSDNYQEWNVFYTDNSNLPNNFVQSIINDGNNGLWLGTFDGGLAHLSQNEKWTVFKTDNSGLPNNIVLTLKKHGKGLWIGTFYGGLALFKSGKWSVFNSAQSNLPGNVVRALLNDRKGGLWIGTEFAGLAHLSENEEWRIFDANNLNIQALARSKSGVIMGTDKFGILSQLSSEEELIPLINTRNSDLPNDNVNALLNDGKGGLWIGTQEGGLAHLSGGDFEWSIFNVANSKLPSNDIRAIAHDGDSGIWLGTRDAGLIHLSQFKEWTIFNSANSELPSNKVTALLSDGKGELWIGTWGGGIAYLNMNKNTWKIYNINNSLLPSNGIYSLTEDNSGGLWFGTEYGGLAHFSRLKKWTIFNTVNSNLPSNRVRTLANDENSGLWVGTYSEGLAHLTFTQKNTLVQTIQDEGTRAELLTDKRAAILIHPRGQGNGYNQAVSIEFMATHAYRTVQNRGYDNDEIYFLSYKPDVDINGDGMVDRNVVDGPITALDLAAGTSPRDLTRADVQQAFDWAKQKGKLDQPLLVIFVDHALTGKLRLDPFDEVLTAEDLNAMLNDYQQATGSEVVVILEACHTGSLVSGLAGPNRLIITSTAENQAYYDNLGSFSFSKFFFDNLRRGDSFYNAFQTVKGKLPTYGHPFNLQVPQLDDDGDGVNSTNDGRLAKKWCLNGCFGALSGEITLESETPAATVTVGQTVSLVVRAGITEGRIKRVWALVMTPEAAKQRNEEGFSLIPTPVVNLSQKPDDASRWQGSFSGFQYRGDYVVTFMAEDNEGFITAAVPVKLTQAEGPEVPDVQAEPEFKIGPNPISSQAVYHEGDTLRVTLPALPADQVQYVALSYPDQTLYFLTGLNGLVFFDGTSVPVWQESGEVAVEKPVTDFPKGDYIVYLLRLPAGIDLLSHPEEWMIGFSTFRVE